MLCHTPLPWEHGLNIHYVLVSTHNTKPTQLILVRKSEQRLTHKKFNICQGIVTYNIDSLNIYSSKLL